MKRDWDKYLKAYQLHQSGLSYREVGKQLGVGKSRASYLVCRYMAEIRKAQNVVVYLDEKQKIWENIGVGQIAPKI